MPAHSRVYWRLYWRVHRRIHWPAFVGFAAATMPFCAVAAEHGAAVGQSDAPVIPPTVWGIIIFGTVLFILWKKAFPPITAALEKRAKLIEDSLKAAEQAKAEAEATMAKHEASFEAARAEARAIIEKGKADAVKVKDDILAAAKHDTEEMAERARREIEMAKRAAVDELHRRSVELSLDIAAKVIRKTLRPEDHDDLIKESIRRFQGVKQTLKIEAVSVTYAHALIDQVAPERLDPVMEDVRFLAKVIRDDLEFRTLLESPSIGGDRKRAVIDKVFRGKLDDLVVDFVELVVVRNRHSLLGEMFASCESLYDAAVGRVRAEVTTAVPLSAERRDAIAAGLGKKLGKHILLHNRVRPEILGGLILRYGNLVADDSVKTSLTRIAGRLLARRPGSELIHEN